MGFGLRRSDIVKKKGQSEVIKALLLIGIMVAAVISYMEMTSSFTSSYEEILVLKSFKQVGSYIVETINHNEAALSVNPEATETVDYVIINLDIPKRAGNHYYTIQVVENKLWIYANDDHSLGIEYPEDGFKGFAVSGRIESLADSHYVSIGGSGGKATLFSSKILYGGSVIPEIGDLDTNFEYMIIFRNANIADSNEEYPQDVNATLYVGSGTILKDYKMKKATSSKPGIPSELKDGKFDNGELFYYTLDLLNEIPLVQSEGSYFYYFKFEFQGKTEKFPADKISGPLIPINLELTADYEYIYEKTLGEDPALSTLTLTVKDRKGAPVENAEVIFSTDLGRFNDNFKTVYSPPGGTNSEGKATAKLESGSVGIATVTVSVLGSRIQKEITIHGVLDHIRIEYYNGTPVLGITMIVGDKKTFYARGYDASDYLIGDVDVTWSATDELLTTDLEPLSGKKTRFTPSAAGTGKIEASYIVNPLIKDRTGWIVCSDG